MSERPADWSTRVAVQTCLVLLVALGPARVRAANFLGPASCRTCHQTAYELWRTSPHARALEALPPTEQKDGRCLVCHARDVALGGEAGVTCETCHGAGQYYWPSYVMRDAEVAKGAGLVAAPDVKSCVLCHDASSPSLKAFDPAAAMPAIDHWSKDRAARGKKSAATCPRPTGSGDQGPRPDETFLGRVLTGRWPAPAPVKTGRKPAAPPAAASSGSSSAARGQGSVAAVARAD